MAQSDRNFGVVHNTQAPAGTHLTLRAAAGYRPEFESLSGGTTGEWTLEGLHLRGHKSWASLGGAIRRLANCSFDNSQIDPLVHRIRPAGEQPLEIENCYIPGTIGITAPDVRISNSVIHSVRAIDEAAGSMHLVRTLVWTSGAVMPMVPGI